MTSPDRPTPKGSRQFGQMSNLQDYDQTSATAAANQDMFGLAEGARGNLLSNILGGFINGIGGFIAQFFAGVFGGIAGGFLDLVGGFLGVRNDVDDVQNIQVPRLDNRIDLIEVGGAVPASRATFGSSATWTKPVGPNGETPVRHVVDLIGGGAGGGRGGSGYTSGAGGGGGGWTSGIQFLDSEVAATMSVIVGAGGAGATADNTNGVNGGGSSFGGLIFVGGGISQQEGYGANGKSNYTGGAGGNFNSNGSVYVAARPGANGPYSNGGAGGVGNQGANGSDGVAPNPATLIAPGSCGGGASGRGSAGNGGRGGNGGYPGGGAGGGGSYSAFGFAGNGGNAASGLVVVTSYFS